MTCPLKKGTSAQPNLIFITHHYDVTSENSFQSYQLTSTVCQPPLPVHFLTAQKLSDVLLLNCVVFGALCCRIVCVSHTYEHGVPVVS